MPSLLDLWLPILLSAVGVFIASSIAWMMLPHHKGDFKKLPNEDELMAAVRNLRVAPGLYFFPHMQDCSKMKNDPAMKAKFEQGPHGILQVWPPNAFTKMGRNMVLVFLFYVITSVFVAYLASMTLPAGTEYLKVFQITGTAAIMAYCFGGIPYAICFGTPLRNILSGLADGIVYGLLTAGIFGWLWPGA